MKIIFCGTIVSEKFDTKLKYLSPAANRFQWNFLKELKLQKNELNILSYIGFPIEKEYLEEIIKCTDANISIEYIFKKGNVFLSSYEYLRALKKSIKDADYVFAYNPLYAWFFLPWMNNKSVLILADFSDMESYNSLFKKLYVYFMKTHIKAYQNVIGLSEKTNLFLKKSQKFLLLEGGLNPEIYSLFYKPVYCSHMKIKILYSGLLSAVTGIDILLLAFAEVSADNVELIITGKGELEDDVYKAAQADKRIHYYGYLEYAEYIKLLNLSHIVVNPRNMNLPENQYNFPSKIIEYLATGRIIISTKFIGNEKFDENIYFVDSDVQSIRKGIEENVYNIENNYNITYENNREFVKGFYWSKQIKRVMEWLKEEK